jgi:hypothetical protein
LAGSSNGEAGWRAELSCSKRNNSSKVDDISGGLERSDMKPEEQLQCLYVSGFDLQTFERFPKAIGVLRDNCLAFLVPGPDGLQILGNVGWRMGESLGPLVERDGRKVFVHKQELIEATPERVATLERFRNDLRTILRGDKPVF